MEKRLQDRMERIQRMLFQSNNNKAVAASAVPANALLAADGTPILAADGSYILVSP